MDENLEWFASADLTAYEGKYVAIAGRKVVAQGEDPGQVYETAKQEHPEEKVVLWKVPREGYCIFFQPRLDVH